ncbi:MAG: hypothetical protein QOH79_2580 [Acidimicrobiaceae bacterium]
MMLLKSGADSSGVSAHRLMIVPDPLEADENGLGVLAEDRRTTSVLLAPTGEAETGDELDDDDDEDGAELDELPVRAALAARRCAAGRAVRWTDGSLGVAVTGFGGFGGAAAESALINPPLAPTAKPAVPNVGVRLSIASERRTGSEGPAWLAGRAVRRPSDGAALCPAIVGGCITRMRLPVARARSSSGEWWSSSKKRGMGDGRAAWTSSCANTSAEGGAFSGDDAKCTTLSTVAARLPALRSA